MESPITVYYLYRDLDSGVSININEDDNKIGRHISSEQEALVLQSEMNRMHEWAVIWQINFNNNKCNTLQVGRNNT